MVDDTNLHEQGIWSGLWGMLPWESWSSKGGQDADSEVM